MGKASRLKGANGERELRLLLEGELGVAIKRNLEQTRSGGHDLDGLPVALEAKRRATVTQGDIEAWWKQAMAQGAIVGLTPALAWRADRQQWRFALPLSALSADYGEWADSEPVEMGVRAFCAAVREMIAYQLCEKYLAESDNHSETGD